MTDIVLYLKINIIHTNVKNSGFIGKTYFHNLFLFCAKLTIYTILLTKLTIHTVNVCGSGYSHIGGFIVDLFFNFQSYML